jgi:hypothetical protein
VATILIGFLLTGRQNDGASPGGVTSAFIRELQGLEGGNETCCICTAPEQPKVDPYNVSFIVQHLEEFQVIANLTGGSREAGSKGYADSIEYVKSTLVFAGNDVEVQMFDALAGCDWECCGTMSTAEKEFDFVGEFWEAWCSPFGSAEAMTSFVGNSGC